MHGKAREEPAKAELDYKVFRNRKMELPDGKIKKQLKPRRLGWIYHAASVA